ncbi:PREDICTED: dephospho-CoA kinase domain-containing protein-like isoform X1 [Priapulus caudatus]|uniref:Dephospho-CoA kinase domain-containing protein-like isoform X1 n=2 Tax=Priapulus caudatus TaxID=37621 RepID=A0ABM1DRL4_PRICU|nr:PREDICTED: dephospho-CoA kinase domain-containing protein-like isoform X1 [Priapulus caudatus]
MFLVGLTGGIGSGKMVEPGTLGWKKLRQHFGQDLFHETTGEIDRQKLANIIFYDEAKRRLLNSITHPEITKSIGWQVVSYFIKGYQFVILDVPLLFESKTMLKYLKYTVVVDCDEEQQLQRVMLRNSFTEEHARARIASQMPLREKCILADYVIANSDSGKNTEVQVKQLYQTLTDSKAQWRMRMFIVLFGFALILIGFWWSGVLLITKYKQTGLETASL